MSFKITEVTDSMNIDMHDVGDLILSHKGVFVASWGKPKDEKAAQGVMEQMLKQAYELGQHHRSNEINGALKKLGVLQ